ncbi:MAG: hypothetical protein KJ958_05595 [Gammaproteobacteria bacterium]|nr:hypothetical protein [Gammaproteobacteria bacterium]MBU1978628.1 hypothetical protein [Gammaproteobacteria bacterium]
MSRPVPAKLAKLGICHVRDNIPEGMEVGGFEKEFVRLFRPEIQAVLRRREIQRAAQELGDKSK